MEEHNLQSQQNQVAAHGSPAVESAMVEELCKRITQAKDHDSLQHALDELTEYLTQMQDLRAKNRIANGDGS